MDYIELLWTPSPLSDDACDVAADALAPLGFDSFTTDSDGLHAYCPADACDEEAARRMLAALPLADVTTARIDVRRVPVEDWNAEWERTEGLRPIVIGTECVVHAPASTDVPACHYDITIDPRMSFGSGHHDTTAQLLEEILKLRLDGLDVLDMGTGTGVLAILAAMHGARAVRAVEIDPRVAEAAAANVERNGVGSTVGVETGDATCLRPTDDYDVVIANINLSVLVADMPRYASVLKPDGVMLLSGFYDADVRALRRAARTCGLKFDYATSRGGWAVVRFVREIEVE